MLLSEQVYRDILEYLDFAPIGSSDNIKKRLFVGAFIVAMQPDEKAQERMGMEVCASYTSMCTGSIYQRFIKKLYNITVRVALREDNNIYSKLYEMNCDKLVQRLTEKRPDDDWWTMIDMEYAYGRGHKQLFQFFLEQYRKCCTCDIACKEINDCLMSKDTTTPFLPSFMKHAHNRYGCYMALKATQFWSLECLWSDRLGKKAFYRCLKYERIAFHPQQFPNIHNDKPPPKFPQICPDKIKHSTIWKNHKRFKDTRCCILLNMARRHALDLCDHDKNIIAMVAYPKSKFPPGQARHPIIFQMSYLHKLLKKKPYSADCHHLEKINNHLLLANLFAFFQHSNWNPQVYIESDDEAYEYLELIWKAYFREHYNTMTGDWKKLAKQIKNVLKKKIKTWTVPAHLILGISGNKQRTIIKKRF